MTAPSQPLIACLCGSTSQRGDIASINRDLTLAGRIVVAPGVFGHDGDPVTDDQKAALDQLHFRKIDMADEVHFIHKPDGSLGESSSRELTYATERGKTIVHHHPADDPDSAPPQSSVALDDETMIAVWGAGFTTGAAGALSPILGDTVAALRTATYLHDKTVEDPLRRDSLITTIHESLDRRRKR